MLEPINPRLYRALQRRFGDVAVSNDGESYIPNRTRSMYRRGQFDSQPAFAGEYYKVNCPFCTDTTKRLYINHMFAVVGEDRDDHLYLAHCFNEGCIDSRDVQKELYELIYPFGYGRRVQQAELTVLVPRSKVEPRKLHPTNKRRTSQNCRRRFTRSTPSQLESVLTRWRLILVFLLKKSVWARSLRELAPYMPKSSCSKATIRPSRFLDRPISRIEAGAFVRILIEPTSKQALYCVVATQTELH
ncbi:MAG TPA: hypothetical protein QF564_04525 [Pirellulaceae bacterium]|nr:hypothetical protein [Pirellulaceae bacterium]